MTATDGAVEASSIPTPQSGDYSLYFHIPFCTRKCDYCHFYVIPDQQRFKEIYLVALKKEWELRRALLPKGPPVSIYFGGGTPALLGRDAIYDVLSWISPPASCEITLEANPENVTLELMRTYAQCGINRISLGIQTFDEELLKTLTRTHSAQKGRSAVEQCYEAGFQNISIDLMYDLPDQSLQSWEQTLKEAIQLPITHLSLYNLTIEPHTVFYKKRNSLVLPNGEVSLAMLQTALDLLDQGGMQRYEISAFAKPDYYSRHNTGYWLGRPFLGFGPSAFSYWGGARFRNVAHLHRYKQALEKQEDPIDFKEQLSEQEALKENLAIGLRLIAGITHPPLPKNIDEGLHQLKNNDFILRNGYHICLTEKGLLFHDTVATEIMSF